LPEQIVALLEKLEQNPDTSHLEKVARLMDHHESTFTKYEEWMLRRTMVRIRNVIRRETTLNRAMSIVINDPTDEEKRMKEREAMYTKLSNSTGTLSGTLSQHAAAQQVQIAHINAHQQLMNQAQYASGYVDARSYWTGGSKCTL
jgi:hypothetical protein